MSTEHLPQRDHGESVLGFGLPLGCDRAPELDRRDDVTTDDCLGVAAVIVGTDVFARLGVLWLLTKRQGR